MVPQVTHTRASGYLARRSLTHSAGGGALRRCRGRGASMSSSAASASVAGSRDSSSATVAPSGGELPDSVWCVSVLMFCSPFAPPHGAAGAGSRPPPLGAHNLRADVLHVARGEHPVAASPRSHVLRRTEARVIPVLREPPLQGGRLHRDEERR